jgi:hypothetical protein
MIDKLILNILRDDQIDEIVSAFKAIGWHKPKNIYEGYLATKRKVFD